MTTQDISESIDRVTNVIRESVKNGERLVALKDRIMKRNAREQVKYELLKNGALNGQHA